MAGRVPIELFSRVGLSRGEWILMRANINKEDCRSKANRDWKEGDAVYVSNRLIAAAPDLLGELKRSSAILILLEDAIHGTSAERLAGPVANRVAMNRDAIARATK